MTTPDSVGVCLLDVQVGGLSRDSHYLNKPQGESEGSGYAPSFCQRNRQIGVRNRGIPCQEQKNHVSGTEESRVRNEKISCENTEESLMGNRFVGECTPIKSGAVLY